MSKHGVDVFDNTFQKTTEWLNGLIDILDWKDKDGKQNAYVVLRATLHALRDRLPFEIAVKFGAQLPMLIRGFYYEGWKPNITPIKVKGAEEFLDFVAARLMNTTILNENDLETIVRAVFEVIAMHISDGEVNHIKQALPVHIAALWPSLITGR